MTNLKFMNMSQVRKLLKLQPGGTTPKTYGHLIIDGIDLGNSEDLYRQFAEHAKLQNAAYGPSYDAWLSKLRNGEDVILGIDNTSNVHPEGMSDAKAGARSTVGRVLGDIFDTERNRYSEAITSGRKFHYVKPKVKKTSNDNSVVNFVFTGENPTYSEQDMTNLAINNRLNNYLDWLENPEWENTNEFSNKLSDAQRSALRAWYDSLQGDTSIDKRLSARQQWDEYLGKVKTSHGYDTLDDATRNFFANFNIGNSKEVVVGGSSENLTPEQEEKRSRTALKNAGYSDNLYKYVDNNFTVDEEGNLVSKNGAFDFGLDLNGARGIAFNDDFYKTLGSTGNYDFLKDYTYYDGTLYKKTSQKLRNILNSSGGFNELVGNGRFDDADKIIRTRFSEGELENPIALASDQYSNFIKPTHRFSNITGLTTLADGSMQDGDQLIQYIDLNDSYEDGPYKRYRYKFALLDRYGDFKRDVDPEELQNIAGGTSAGDLNTRILTNATDGVYKDKYYIDIKGRNGDPSKIRIYQDKNDPNNVILHIDDSDWKLKAGKGKDIILPREVAEVLMRDKSWIDTIIKDPGARQNFGAMLTSLIQGRDSMKRQSAFRNWMYPLGLLSAIYMDDPDYEKKQLRRIGIKEDQIKDLQKALYKASKGNKYIRRGEYLVDTPEFRKGGKLDYIAKLASGGVSGGTQSSKGVSEMRVDGKVKDQRNAASLGQLGTNDWTDADTKDLLALVGDTASLGLAFVPGANLASMATGVAGSFARYAADRERGLEGAGKNLAINLGMDAVTLLPFLGGLGKTAKVAKGASKATDLLRKASRFIISSAAVYGMGSAVVNSASKIANGEKFTVRDISNVVNAVTAGVHLTKNGGFGKTSKNVDVPESIRLKGNSGVDGTVEVKIEGNTLKNVTTPEKFKEVVYHAAKRSGDTAVTMENVSERYDLSKFISSKTRGRKNPEQIEKLRKLRTTAVPQTEEATGDWFHDWWYGLGKTQRTYRANTGTGDKVVGVTKNNGKIRSRVDIAEAQGTTPGARYYQDEFGTWYKVGTSKTVDASAKQIARARALPERRAINDRNGFTGKVKVFERAVDPFEHVWYYPKTGVANFNIIGPIQHGEYSYDSYAKGGVIKAQKGFGDMPIDTSNMQDAFIRGLGRAIEFGVNAKGIKYNTNTMDQALRNQHTPIGVRLQQYDTRNPIIEQRQAYLNSLLTKNERPITSDVKAQIADKLATQRQVLDAGTQNTQMASQEQAKVSKAQTDLENKQLLMDQEIANTTNDKLDAIRIERAKNLISGNLQSTQSLTNAIREIRARTESDLNLAKDDAYNRRVKATMDEYDKALQSKYSDQYSAWNTLDNTTRNKYSGFEDYLRRAEENKDVWDEEYWTLHQKNLQDALDRIRLTTLNPLAGTIYRSRMKRGGRLRNRYKNEPEEDVWINQNKAVHKAVAQLNDDIVKIFLKTLK